MLGGLCCCFGNFWEKQKRIPVLLRLFHLLQVLLLFFTLSQLFDAKLKVQRTLNDFRGEDAYVIKGSHGGPVHVIGGYKGEACAEGKSSCKPYMPGKVEAWLGLYYMHPSPDQRDPTEGVRSSTISSILTVRHGWFYVLIGLILLVRIRVLWHAFHAYLDDVLYTKTQLKAVPDEPTTILGYLGQYLCSICTYPRRMILVLTSRVFWEKQFLTFIEQLFFWVLVALYLVDVGKTEEGHRRPQVLHLVYIPMWGMSIFMGFVCGPMFFSFFGFMYQVCCGEVMDKARGVPLGFCEIFSRHGMWLFLRWYRKLVARLLPEHRDFKFSFRCCGVKLHISAVATFIFLFLFLGFMVPIGWTIYNFIPGFAHKMKADTDIMNVFKLIEILGISGTIMDYGGPMFEELMLTDDLGSVLKRGEDGKAGSGEDEENGEAQDEEDPEEEKPFEDQEPPEEEDLDKMFANLDKNGDGVVTIDEMRQQYKEQGIEMTPQAELAIQQIFDQADVNGDGAMDIEEFRKEFKSKDLDPDNEIEL